MSHTGASFNQEVFTALLHDLANLSKALVAILSEVPHFHHNTYVLQESAQKVSSFTRSTLQASTNVVKTQATDANARNVLEKYLAVLTHTLLKIRDAI